MRAIIIGAGRGARLMPKTETAPKCFTEVAGRRILDWILLALEAGGVTEVCFIGGYHIDSVRRDYPEFIFRHNEDWRNNNILASLMCAEDLMDQPFITTYSDILYKPQIIRDLIRSADDISLCVDTDWHQHYRFRTCHPTADAEKIKVRDGHVVSVSRSIREEEAYGEFIGVGKFSSVGGAQLRAHYHRCRNKYAGQEFRGATTFEKAYLIHLFQEMLEAGVPFGYVATAGMYREIDTLEDLRNAEEQWVT